MSKFKPYLPLFIISLAGFLLRIYNITAISLWHDEAFSALLIRYSWSEMFYRIGLDVHPPMYYVFLRFWHYIFGDSLFSLRGFSLLFGVLIIPAVYFLIKAAFKSEKAAIIGALLIALSPFQINYVTEARMYTMGAFFAVLSAYGLVKALQLQRQYYEKKKDNQPNRPEDKRLRRKFIWFYILFTVSTIIIIYTHYYLLFTAAAIGFYGLLYHIHAYKGKFKRYTALIISFLAIGLSFLPWLKTFLFQYNQVGGNYWIGPMTRWSIPDTLWNMLFGIYTSWIPNHLFLVIVTLITLFVGYVIIRRISSFEKWLVILNVIAPFAGAILFAIWRNSKAKPAQSI